MTTPAHADRVLVVDWSAAARPVTGRDSIWQAELARGAGAAVLTNPRTRAAWARAAAVTLSGAVAGGERVLVAIDAGLGYPAGFACALGVGGAGEPGAGRWRAVAELLAGLVVDGDDNANNRFEVAAELNRRCGALGPDDGPFWGHPRWRVYPTLGPRRPTTAARPSPVVSREPRILPPVGPDRVGAPESGGRSGRRPVSAARPSPVVSGGPRVPPPVGPDRVAAPLREWRRAEQLARGAGWRVQPVWKLSGAGSVGGQTLLALAWVVELQRRLAPIPCRVWPQETGVVDDPWHGRPGVVVAECWPPAHHPAAHHGAVGAHPVRDAAQVLAAVPVALAFDRWAAVDDVGAEEGWILGLPTDDPGRRGPLSRARA